MAGQKQGLLDSNFPLFFLLGLRVSVFIVRESPSKKSKAGVRSFRLTPDDFKRALSKNA
jgi:hypothetical protein